MSLGLGVPWSLQPRNRAAAATCGHHRWELPAILRVTPTIASDCQRRRDDSKNNFSFLNGGDREVNCPEMLFFIGNATTIEFRKCKLYCREILLSLRRLLDCDCFAAGETGNPTNGCEPARGHHGRCDFAMRALNFLTHGHHGRCDFAMRALNFLTKVLTKMHTGVDMSTEMPTKVQVFCVKPTQQKHQKQRQIVVEVEGLSNSSRGSQA